MADKPKERPITRRDRLELNPEILVGKAKGTRLSVEIVSAVDGALTDLSPALLMPDVLPELWNGPELSIGEIAAYFSGKTVIRLKMEGFRQKATVPRFERVVLEAAVGEAVRSGKLWLLSGASSILGERVPIGMLHDHAKLRLPPPPMSANDVLPETLPEAWLGSTTTGAAIHAAIAAKSRMATPWGAVRAALVEAFEAGLLERAPGSGPFPCDSSGATSLRVQKPTKRATKPKRTGALAAEAELNEGQLRSLADRLEAIAKAVEGYDIKFFLRVETGSEQKVPDDAVQALNAILGVVSEDLRIR
jgi:hypothetical protein